MNLKAWSCAVAVLFLVSCSPVPTADCRASCPGCCTVDGQCQSGNSPLACGQFGTSCASCPGGQQCFAGACVPTSTGCTGCTQSGVCRPGTADDACGTSGECATCASGSRCVSGACRVVLEDGGVEDAGVEDAGLTTDAGLTDAGTTDAGISDAGIIDAGTPDAGQPDAGLLPDGGMRVCASGDVCTASYVNGGCCSAYPNCRGTPTAPALRCRASCGVADVTCTSANDCCTGLSCQAGLCKTADAGVTPVDAGTTTDAGVLTSCVGLACTTWNECCAGVEFCRGASAGAPPTCQRTPGASGQRCVEDEDCASPLTCNSGVCGTKPCGVAGTNCTSGNDCCTNAPYCTSTLTSNQQKCSAQPGRQGAKCTDVDDCQSPYGCANGFCAEVNFNCRMLHQGCTNSFQCCDGQGLGDLWCAPGDRCYPLACGGIDDLCPGGENDGCCSGLVCFGGLCKPPGTFTCDGEGVACLLDTCCPGLQCYSKSGNCEVPQTNCGQLYSTCSSSAQCCGQQGLFCNNGICDYGTLCKITGQSCAGGESCCGGLSCTSGTCQPTSTCRLANQACSASSTCCNGLTCTSGVCREPLVCRTAGQTCGGGTQCCNGLACTNGVCQSSPTCTAAGQSCSSARQCCASVPFCRGTSATSATTCTASCAPDGAKAATQADCCSGLTIDANGVCRAPPMCLSSGTSCLSSATPCCSSARFCRASSATGTPTCSATCAGDGMRAKSPSDCCAGTTLDAGGVCRAPPSCKASGSTCNAASECCSSAPFCGASVTNQLWTCRSACVPRLGSASSTNDCCAGLVKNAAGWCDTPCGAPGTGCNNNGACCSLSCHPTQFVCN